MAGAGFEPRSDFKAPLCSVLTDPESELESDKGLLGRYHLLVSSTSLIPKVQSEHFGFPSHGVHVAMENTCERSGSAGLLAVTFSS